MSGAQGKLTLAVITSDFHTHLAIDERTHTHAHTHRLICIVSGKERGSETVECADLIRACHSQLAAWLKIRIAKEKRRGKRGRRLRGGSIERQLTICSLSMCVCVCV